MCSVVLLSLLFCCNINQRSVLAVQNGWTSTNGNNLPTQRSTALDENFEGDNRSINPLHSSTVSAIESFRGGTYLIPSGWNPMGYKITALGEQFLSLGGSLECDVGRFIASLKSSRKRRSTIKDSWLEIVRASKTGQAMRIYRTIDELIDFCIKTGLID
jgi:hypothetical protein